MSVYAITLLLLQFVIAVIGEQQYVPSWPNKVTFWPEYPSRAIQVLDGEWEFSYNTYKGDITSQKINTTAIPTTNTTTVPSSFDYVEPGYEGKRGTAFYRTKFNIAPGHKALVNFAACSFYCNVYVDNKWIGEHRAGGFAPFWLDIPASTSEIRTIFVIADNRFNPNTAPLHTGGDFYHFGGIHRSVIVHELLDTKLYLVNVEVIPQSYSPAVVDIKVLVGEGYNGTLSLMLSWDSGASSSISAEFQNGIFSKKGLTVPNAKVWNLTSPNLHTLTVVLPNKDSIKVRFGIRVFKRENGRITINDVKVKLHGHNRHTIFPGVGPSLTVDQIMIDVQLLQDLGDNYVRGAHYPQDQRFLDICDEKGIIIWEEALGPSVSTKNTQDPYFMKYQVQQMNEMISASINHPSVMFWGFFNEGPADDAKSCPGYKTCADTAHERDRSRFVTWANNHDLSDKCLNYTDVISFNSYPGWYFGGSAEPIQFWNNLINSCSKQYTQPITVSETGCEGLWEWVNTSTVMWGQAYQNVVITNDVETILGNPRVSGLTLWAFSDFKGNDGAQSECGPCHYAPGTHNATEINIHCDGRCGLGCRPCGENHKGTVDFWRRKKQVYNIVKDFYHRQWP